MISAFIINRNLVTTLKNTIKFLQKHPKINIFVIDQDSTYDPLLHYYESLTGIHIIRLNKNEGPYSAWNVISNSFKNDEPFIVCDSDCTYDTVPDDWLDKMIFILEHSSYDKVGFSLEIEDLPSNGLAKSVYSHEKKFWQNSNEFGFIADVDTTFAMYKPRSPFTYKAIRMNRPYTIRHELWYIDDATISYEWRYYLHSVSNVSSWGHNFDKWFNKN